jgi:hypothetical protein
MSSATRIKNTLSYPALLLLFALGAASTIGSNGGGGDGGSPATYELSGSILTGFPTQMTITLSGQSSETILSDYDGNFVFSGLSNGNYTITPSNTPTNQYAFSPASVNVSINGANLSGIRFISIGIVSGAISGDITEGVTLNVSGTTSGTATSDANGIYRITDLPNGRYTVTPSASGYTFTPASQVVDQDGNGRLGLNFTSSTASTPLYSVSGTVSGDIHANVRVEIEQVGAAGDTTETLTDLNGDYSFENLTAGADYEVRVNRFGYTATDNGMIDIFNLQADSPGNDFTLTVDTPDVDRYAVSGNVSYNGSQSGDIYIVLEYTFDATSFLGTSLSAPGNYTVRGVWDGTDLRALAWMDTDGNGIPNASDPIGRSSDSLVNGADVLNVNVVLADPAPPLPVAPADVLAFPTDQGALVAWHIPQNSDDFEIADKYDVYWSTSPSVGPGNNIGSATDIQSQGDSGIYLVGGLTNGQQLYFAVRAKVGNSTSGVTTSSASTIGAPTGGHTVSGLTTFPVTATGPMLVAVRNYKEDTPAFYVARIDSPTSPQSFNVTGVADGDYYITVAIDMNNNNVIDLGDLHYDSSDFNDSFTVSNADVYREISLSSDNSSVRLMTEVYTDDLNTFTANYSVYPELNRGVKRATKVSIISGPAINTPIDVGFEPSSDIGHFESDFFGVPMPRRGDIYTYEVTYSDGSSETLLGTVSDVLTNFPTPVSPVGVATGEVHPTFTWTVPFQVPRLYYYDINVYGTSSSMWDTPWVLPHTTTSVEYNFDGGASQDPLTSGEDYWWHLILIDEYGNRATVQTQFTP